MDTPLQRLAEKNFRKFPQTFCQLTDFYADHVKGQTVVIIGAGRNTLDAAQGMIPLFVRKRR